MLIRVCEGHRTLYFKNVLHRDVSLTNILLCAVGSGKDCKTIGCLIDLDNAKVAPKQRRVCAKVVTDEVMDSTLR